MSIQEIDIAGFSRIRVEGACSVEVLRSDGFGIVVPQEDFGHIKFRRDGDTLTIGRKGIASIFLLHNRPRAVITMPELVGLSLSGASHGKVVGFNSGRDLFLDLNGASHLEVASVETDRLKVKISGASNLSGEVRTAREARFDISGASRVELTGSGESARIDVSGASQARLARFALGSSDIGVSGASSASLKVNRTLDVSISGASRLEYIGNASLGRVSVSGASTLKQG
jgi:hypothetical protein